MAKQTTKKLRIGFVGCGGISHFHGDSYKKMNDVEIVAACDIHEGRLKIFCDKYAVQKSFTDWKVMLNDVKMDAISVCTPNGVHMAPTVDALNAGCHVLVEKPLAMNAGEGQKMLDASRKNKKHLMVGFQYRFNTRSRLLRKAVEEGFFGKIMYVRVQALRRRGIPNWGVFGRKELQGGGPMIDIGVHALEMAHYVLGSPEPVSAFGNTWTYFGNKPSDTVSMWPNWDHKTYNVEDLAVGMLRMKTGAMISVEASFVAHIEKEIFSFTIVGEKGGATWEPFGLFYDEAGLMVNATPAFLPTEDHFHTKMRHFADVCLYNLKCEAPIEQGLMVQKMLDSIYAASAAGKEVKID